MGDLTQTDFGALFGAGDQPQEDLEAEEKKVVPYDFSAPPPVPSEQRKTIQLIHEKFAKNLQVTISSFLRTDAEVHLESVEQMDFGHYSDALVTPTCLATFDMDPLQGFGVVEINPAILYSVVNRMVGGSLQVPKESRPFTDLELSVVQRLVKIMLRELSNAWAVFLSIDFSFKEIQTNPAFVQVISTGDLCVITALKIKIASTLGMITLCLPYSSLEPITGKLAKQAWEKFTPKYSEELKEAHKKNFYEVPMQLTAQLGTTDLTFFELLALQAGDVVSLNQRARDPLSLLVGGVHKFTAKPGLVGKYKGVIIDKEIGKGAANG